MQKFGNILQLRYIVFPVATIFNQEWENVVEFTTSVSGIQFGKFPKDGAPCGYLLRSVLDARDRLAAESNMKK